MSSYSKKPVLGKGLDALLGTSNSTSEKIEKTEEYKKVHISQLRPDERQPRKNFSKQPLAELAESIRKKGILQPILVSQIKYNEYVIIAGERRWRAASIIGLEEIPIITKKNVSSQESLVLALIENLNREDLNPIEQAKAIERLIQEFNFTHEAVGKELDKSRTDISNKLRLLALPLEVQELLKEGKLTAGHAKALLAFSEDKRVDIAKLIVEKNLTVREVEALTKSHGKQAEKEHELTEALIQYREIAEKLSKRFSNCLASKTQVLPNAKGEGRVVIKFSSLDEVEWILNKLEK